MPKTEFDEWCAQLDAYAERIGYQKNLSADTGVQCWRDYYDDEYSPEDALNEDLCHG